MERFKYIKNISDRVGTIELYNQIGDSVDKQGNIKYGISGSSFCNEMQYLQTCCDQINVCINSIGGNVIDGYSIISSILNSTVNCDTYITGLAASISGVIALSGKKCHIASYGSFMLHDTGGSEDKKLLAIVKDTLVTIMSERTKKTPDEIAAMMKKETWISNSKKADFTLEQGVTMGFFDKIITNKKTVKIVHNSLHEIAEIYNKLNQPEIKMEQVTNLLGVTNEAEAVKVINQRKVDADALKVENDSLKAKIVALEKEKTDASAAELTALTNKATALVEKGVTEGKIKAEKKDETIKAAIANFDVIENMLSMASAVKPASKIFDVKNVAVLGGKTEDRSSWTIRDWEKKDEKGLLAIKNETPEVYQSMFDAFYKK